MKIFDTIIIGNGIIGNSVCYALNKEDPTLKIALLGEFSHQNGATLAAGAMLNCFAELTSLSLKTEAGKANVDLAYDALNLWPDWIDCLNDELLEQSQLKINPGTFIIHNAK